MKRSSRVVAAVAGASGTLALTYLLPSVLILPALTQRSPEQTVGELCRWRWSTVDDVVCLTFDDGPAATTPATLDLLDTLGLRATFFVLGEQVRAYPDAARLIVARGHEIASHGDAHRSHLLRSPGWVRRDLVASMQTHEQTLGARPRFHRPPYGHVSLATLIEARRCGLRLILWSGWGKEFSDLDSEAGLARLERSLAPGAVLLLHDNDVTCPPGTAAVTRRMLPGLKDLLERRGLRTALLSDMLRPFTDAPA